MAQRMNDLTGLVGHPSSETTPPVPGSGAGRATSGTPRPQYLPAPALSLN